MDLQSIGRMLLAFGAILVVVGGLFWLGGRLGLGALPGDVKFSGQHWSASAPIATSIILSLVLTIAINIVWRLFGR